MNTIFPKFKLFHLLAVFVILELLSFLAFFFSELNLIVLALIFILFLFISFKNIELAFLLILSELIIGSHGHLFTINLSFLNLSLRMLIWLAFLIVFIIKLRTYKSQIIDLFKKSKILKTYLLLAIFCFFALIFAFLNSNNLNFIFSDFNSWLFFLLIIPAALIYSKAKQEKLERLKKTFILAVFWLSLKTLILLFLFSHDLSFLPDLYRWLRNTYMAEVTVLPNAWPRIFLQSQIYAAIAFLYLTFKSNFKSKLNLNKISLLSVFLSAVIISFSRSFWLAFILVFFLFSLFYIIKLKDKKKIKLWLIQNVSSVILAFLLIFAVNNIPLLSSTSDFNLKTVKERASYRQDEAALASRWSLLPVLMNEIKERPFFGYGFGASLWYQSSDPRVLENNEDGWYETYVFEWGYLDLWHKLGLAGLLSYLFLIIILIYNSFKQSKYFFLAPVVAFLALVHFFTPYLNHPLGIMIIILCSCLLLNDEL